MKANIKPSLWLLTSLIETSGIKGVAVERTAANISVANTKGKLGLKERKMMLLRRTLWLIVASMSVVSFGVAGCTPTAQTNAQTTQTEPGVQAPQREPDVVYVPTPQEVVNEMLALAKVTKKDVIYDLGSGDGRIPITAAQKYGTRGVGIDINPERIREAKANAKKAGVTDRVKFLQQDLFQTDVSEATVVTLYLLPQLNVKLRPRLFKQLKPGTRVVSHDFDMGDWKPDKVVRTKEGSTIYFWTIPKQVPANLRSSKPAASS